MIPDFFTFIQKYQKLKNQRNILFKHKIFNCYKKFTVLKIMLKCFSFIIKK